MRSKRQITKGIGNEEAVEWKTVCVAPDQSVCSACFAKRANLTKTLLTPGMVPRGTEVQ